MVFPYRIVFKGERLCGPLGQNNEQIEMKPTKECGKFKVEQRAPNGYSFTKTNKFVKIIEDLTNINGECNYGICTLSL